MIKMEALGRQNYNGVWYLRGETIPVANQLDHDDMVAMHLAKPVSAPAPVLSGKQDRSMDTEQTDPLEDDDEKEETSDTPDEKEETSDTPATPAAPAGRAKAKGKTTPYKHREMRPS